MKTVNCRRRQTMRLTSSLCQGRGQRVRFVNEWTSQTGAEHVSWRTEPFPQCQFQVRSGKHISAADGTNCRHYGGNEVKCKVGDEYLPVCFDVTNVPQPMLTVNSVNEANARAEFPSVGLTGPHGIRGVGEHGLGRGACPGCSCCLQRWQRRWPRQILGVDEPMDLVARPKAAAMAAPREPSKAERGRTSCTTMFLRSVVRGVCRGMRTRESMWAGSTS